MKWHRAEFRRRRIGWLSGLLIVPLLVVSCATTPSGEPRSQQASAPRATNEGPKLLRLGFREESPGGIHGGSSGTPEREVGELLNAGLTYYAPSGDLAPKLATKVPSVADGDWVVGADGSMEVTWRLKPGLKWHDGAAFTAEDLVFSIRVFKDPAWALPIPFAATFIGEATAPDAQTLVLKYGRINNGMGVMSSMELPPLPRHLLEETYRQGGASVLGNSNVFTTEWVGMGPYKLTGRTLGSHIEAAAFDDYVLGRPKIDRLVVKWTLDPGALVARLLSDDIDMIPNNLEAAQAAILKQQWESAGRGTVRPVPTRIRQLQLNYRDPTAPWAADIRVRQAMAHLLDRQGLVDSVLAGLSTVGDTALLPNDPAFPLLERRGIPKYPYDRTQGERLLEAAGYQRGADGFRQNAAGQVLRFNPSNVGESDQDETLVMVAGFRDGGIFSEPDIIPEVASDQAERRSKSNGVARPAVTDASYWDRFLASQAASEANRWRGVNTGGYTHPTFERLVGEWRTLFETGPLTEKTADLHKFLLDELAAIPLYYQVEVFAFRKGLQGPGAFTSRGRNATVDIHNWTLE